MTGIEIIVPVRNAAEVLAGCLEAIRHQSVQADRVHLVVGPSGDDSVELARSAASNDSRIVVHDNPAGDRGSAINVALASLNADTMAVAMVDAQSRLEPDYLERSASVLAETGAAVVGGPMRPVGIGIVGTAIAAALSSSVGVGNSTFHFELEPRDVDSVYLGVYRRSILDAVGPYDAGLLRTEDDDMNARIRAMGGRIRLDPSIRSRYIGRQSIPALFRQYHGYGYWKVALARKRPDAIRWRHLVPAVFLGVVVLSAIVSIVWSPPAFPVLVASYLAVLLIIGLLTGRDGIASRLLFPLAVATMHIGYGLGTWHAVLVGGWRR